ncbi:MAG: hypothetical protein ACI8QC_003965 [Planctomycetota bacterium]|jgi:hypothetical protein
MSRLVAWMVHISVLAVGLTGVVYGVMRYVLEPADEFALVNHPAEPNWKAAHILLAPLLLFACGLVWRGHVWLKISMRMPERRLTGILLALLLLPMAASGYLLQVSEQDSWREIWIWTHGISGSLWVLTYIAHRLGSDD